MLSWEQVLISALVGAAIGYITNWIAIKMLFRPIRVKRVLGIRVPFTPGVIPKEKDRLARSIGDAVSKHLLTREYISGQLLSPKTEEQVHTLIREKVSEVNGKTVRELLDATGIDSRVREESLRIITGRLLKGTRDRRLIDFMAARLATGVVHLLDRKPSELTGTHEFKVLRDYLEKTVVNFFSRRESRRHFQHFIIDRVNQVSESTLTVKELIPAGLLEDLRNYIGRQTPHVVSVVNSYLNAPETKKLLAKRVEGFFGQGMLYRLMGNLLGKLGSNSSQVADKIVDEVAVFFAEPENRKLLAQKMELMFNDLLDRRVCDLAAKVEDETRKKTMLELGEWLSDELCSGEILTGLLNRMEKILAGVDTTWGQILFMNDPEKARQEAQAYFVQVIEKITGRPEFETQLEDFLNKLALLFVNLKVNDLWPDLDSGETVLLEERLLVLYRGFVDRYLPDILDFVNFSQLVSRRVDALDVLQVEELVLGIMRRELVAITWLGALLGAGIGISMVVLQLFI